MPETPGQRLAAARHEAQLTQRQLADAVGRHPITIAKLETGHAWPSLRLAISLAGVLGATVEALFGDHAPNSKRVRAVGAPGPVAAQEGPMSSRQQTSPRHVLNYPAMGKRTKPRRLHHTNCPHPATNAIYRLANPAELQSLPECAHCAPKAAG